MQKLACEEALSQVAYELQSSDPCQREDLIRRKMSLKDSLRTLTDLMQNEVQERASYSTQFDPPDLHGLLCGLFPTRNLLLTIM
jgi:hypothetical protein